MARLQRIAAPLLPIIAFCLYLVLASREAENAAAQGDILLAANVRLPAPALLPAANEEPLNVPVDAVLVMTEGKSATTDTPPTAPAIAQNEKTEAETGVKRRRIWAVVTAYCPCHRCCGPWADGRTSLGLSAWRPGVAADPRALSYGTRVYIEGYGEAMVDDTGGILRRTWRRKGQIHLDVRMTYHWQARQWGRREMWVEILP